jgi:hypothetical protein
LEVGEVTRAVFLGCRHLRFDAVFMAKRQFLANGAVFWLRDEAPQMVQFCQYFGRINSPYACLSKRAAICTRFKEAEHNFEIPDEEGT